MIYNFFSNIAIIVASIFLVSQVSLSHDLRSKSPWGHQLFYGLSLGILGVILMMYSFNVTSIVHLDLRHIVIALAGIYGGPFAAILSGFIVAAFRIILFGINEASLLAAVGALSIGILSAYAGGLRKSVIVKHLITNAFGVLVMSIVVYVLVGSFKGLHGLFGIYWSLSVIGGALSFIVCEYMRNSINSFRELRYYEELHKFINEYSTDIISRLNANLEYIYVSPAINHLLGYEPEELIGNPATDLIFPDDYGTIYESLKKAMNSEVENRLNMDTLRYRMYKKDGELVWMETTARVIRNSKGDIAELLGVSRDISERVAMESRLIKSEEKISNILESITDAFFALDKKWRFTYMNKSAEKVLGKKKEEVLGKVIWDEFPRIIGTSLFDEYHRAVKEKESIVVQEYYSFVGSWFETKVFPTKDGISVYLHDITESKRVEEELQRLSTIDGLTGIANRRYFDETLEREWQRCSRVSLPLSLIMLDIDYFKLFNDTYGHLAGDECLKTVANTLTKVVKRGGDSPVRYGGEEFAIILPETDVEGAKKVAERIRASIEALGIPHITSEVHNMVTCSVGAATIVPTANLTQEILISRADNALYEAKHKGRNRINVE